MSEVRLVDANALLEKAWDADTRIGLVQVVDVGDILDAPTIDAAQVIIANTVTNRLFHTRICGAMFTKFIVHLLGFVLTGKGEKNERNNHISR